MSSSLRLFLPSFSRSLPCFALHLFLPSLPPSHFLHSRVTQREHAKIHHPFHLATNSQPLISSDIVEAVLSAVDIALDATVGPFWEANEAIDWFEINQRR